MLGCENRMFFAKRFLRVIGFASQGNEATSLAFSLSLLSALRRTRARLIGATRNLAVAPPTEASLSVLGAEQRTGANDGIIFRVKFMCKPARPTREHDRLK